MNFARIACLSVIMLAALPAASFAQTAKKPPQADLMPPVGAATTTEASPKTSVDPNLETHPSLNLSPDKSELVRLPREASSVIVGNPGHITVLLDTPKLAVVIPRNPGATYFSILDKNGDVIMQRHVIVAAPKKNYVRVRRSCGNAGSGVACKPTSVYFCPDMCHEIGASGEGGAGGDAAATAVPE